MLQWWKVAHRISYCKKIIKEKEKSENAVNEIDNIILCTIINKITERRSQKESELSR